MSEQHDLFTVTCEGPCGMTYLAGHGLQGDPLLDSTYDDERQTFVCSMCYARYTKTSPTVDGPKIGKN